MQQPLPDIIITICALCFTSGLINFIHRRLQPLIALKHIDMLQQKCSHCNVSLHKLKWFKGYRNSHLHPSAGNLLMLISPSPLKHQNTVLQQENDSGLGTKVIGSRDRCWPLEKWKITGSTYQYKAMNANKTALISHCNLPRWGFAHVEVIANQRYPMNFRAAWSLANVRKTSIWISKSAFHFWKLLKTRYIMKGHDIQIASKKSGGCIAIRQLGF